MSALDFIELYLLTAAAFFAVDFIWITRIARSFYREHIGDYLSEDPVVSAAVGFYALYLVGVVVFAILPGLEADSILTAAGLGALFGLVAYATFDLTCMALFKNFPGIVVAVDLVWGTILTSATATIGYLAGRWLGM